MADIADRPASNPIVAAARSIFISMGILPVLLIGSVILFRDHGRAFLDGRNLFNVVRQTTYLAIVSMGQMVCLLTAGFDLSIGSTMALTSVVSALVIISYLASSPEAYTMAIILGLIAGIGVGVIVGSINGIGVAVFNVPPFMMTLGMLSVVLGVALTISGGTPIYAYRRSSRRCSDTAGCSKSRRRCTTRSDCSWPSFSSSIGPRWAVTFTRSAATDGLRVCRV